MPGNIVDLIRENRAYWDFNVRLRATRSNKPLTSGYACSRAAAESNSGICSDCGGHLYLEENGDFVCEDCGQTVLYDFYATFNMLYR